MQYRQGKKEEKLTELALLYGKRHKQIQLRERASYSYRARS